MAMYRAYYAYFISCKKENIDSDTPQSPTYEKLIPKINAWLDEQKNGLSAASVARIDSLKLNLSYGEMHLEKYKDSKELIVIPVLAAFKSASNRDKDPSNYLVVVFENQDSITRGNIIQYISSNSQKAAPQNTFSKIFTYKDLDCSGQFTVLSITEDFRYELKFENGKLKSVAEQTKKTGPKSDSGKVNVCIDWYLSTTYYYADGTSNTIEEYLFTTCEPECQTRMAHGIAYRVNCDGSGGGGGNNGIEYVYAVSRPWKWDVKTTADWWAQSYETVGGIRSNTEPNGGHFTDISHNSSYFVTFITGWTWTEVGYVVSVDDPQRVYATVTGRAALGNFNNTYSNYAFGSFTQLIGP